MTLKGIRALLLDMDGVLWRGPQPIGDLPPLFQICDKKRIQYMFVTNNSTRTPEHFAEKLAGFGVVAPPEWILTSATATAARLRSEFPQGGGVYMIGEDGLLTALGAAGFTPDAVAPLAVVAGLDTQLTYAKIATAARLIAAGVPFYGTNPDPTLPTPAGPTPGAGAVLAAIETASGHAARIIGKPEPEMFLQAIRTLGLEPSECLVVGDRVETDIRGGQAAGCPTALVLSGASASAGDADPPPDLIAPDLAAVIERLP